VAGLARLYLLRSAVTWLLARLLLAVVMATAALLDGGTDAGTTVVFDAIGEAVIVLACAALGMVDIRRRGERALLGNFGVRPAVLVAWIAGPAVAGEIVLALLLGGGA